MSQMPESLDQSRILIFSGRLYSLLLLAYPTRFRRTFGREMAQVFRDDIRGTFQESGAVGAWSFAPLLVAVAWLGFIVSMIMNGYSLEGSLTITLAMLLGISWLLLGIGLWTGVKEESGPALPA